MIALFQDVENVGCSPSSSLPIEDSFRVVVAIYDRDAFSSTFYDGYGPFVPVGDRHGVIVYRV